MATQTSVIHSAYLQDFAQQLLAKGAEGWKADPKFPVMDAHVITIGLVREVEDTPVAAETQDDAEKTKPAVTQPKSPGRPPVKK